MRDYCKVRHVDEEAKVLYSAFGRDGAPHGSVTMCDDVAGIAALLGSNRNIRLRLLASTACWQRVRMRNSAYPKQLGEVCDSSSRGRAIRCVWTACLIADATHFVKISSMQVAHMNGMHSLVACGEATPSMKGHDAKAACGCKGIL